MKSRVELDIRAPLGTVAELMADPLQMTKWMDDVANVEALSGQLGTTGSTFRIASRDGNMDFVATVVLRNLPTELRLHLAGASVDVTITDRFIVGPEGATHLVSEEVFTFHTLMGKLFGFLGQMSIRKAHRRHMESFRRFAQAPG